MATTTTRVPVNGYALAAIRVALGVGRIDVAKAAAIDVSYLSRIESGQRPFLSPEKFAALARWASSYGIDRRAFLAYPGAETDDAQQAS